VIDQCDPDIYGPTVLKHVLPESKVREKGEEMALEVGCEEVLRIWVRLHVGIVGERQNGRHVLLGMKDR
jgi:hypothetical protein